MKYILLSMTLLVLSCKSGKSQTKTEPQPQQEVITFKEMDITAQKKEAPERTRNLIIYYKDDADLQPLLDVVKKEKLELIYQYKNFKAIAVKVPDDRDLEGVKSYLQTLAGVLSVNYDEVNQIQGTGTSEGSFQQ